VRCTWRFFDNLIFRISIKDPTASCTKTAQQINEILINHITSRIISNRLRERKLFSYVAVRKPLLKPTDRLKRVNFCRQLLKMSDDQLSKIIYSDESNFEVINRKSRVIIRRRQTEKFNHNFVIPRLQGGGGSVGVHHIKRSWSSHNI